MKVIQHTTKSVTFVYSFITLFDSLIMVICG